MKREMKRKVGESSKNGQEGMARKRCVITVNPTSGRMENQSDNGKLTDRWERRVND